VPGSQRAPVSQDQRAQGHHRLGRREHVRDRVPLPRDRAGRVRVTAPDIDHRLAVQVHRGRGTDIILIQRFRQRLPDGAEPLIADTLNLSHDQNLTGHPPARATE